MKKFLENIIHLKEAIYLKLQKLRKKWVILKKRENIYNKLKTFILFAMGKLLFIKKLLMKN